MTTTTPKYMAVQGAALLVAGVFILIGVLGFIPGVTTDYALLDWAGHHSGAKLFGVFAVSGLHNVIHLISGVVGVALARTYAASRAYFLGGGLVYLAFWLQGLLMDQAQRQSPARQRRRQLAAFRPRRGYGAARPHPCRSARSDQAASRPKTDVSRRKGGAWVWLGRLCCPLALHSACGREVSLATRQFSHLADARRSTARCRRGCRAR